MENSSNDTEPRCPCGFWGSPQTLGLCSVCFRKARRNQSHSQGSLLTSDAGKSGVGPCHNQTQQSTGQGVKMDSRHFPSRSTTDNLPSSLSSPPGERGALSATTMNDASTSTPTTTTCSNGTSVATVPAVSSHLSGLKSPDGKVSSNGSDLATPSTGGSSVAPCPAGTAKPLTGNSSEQQQQQQNVSLTPSPSDTDTCSSASSDLSYDPKRDPALLCPSSTSVDSCSSSLVSASASTTVAAAAASSSNNFLPRAQSSASSGTAGESTAMASQSSEIVPSSSARAQQQQTSSAESSASSSTVQPSLPNTAAAAAIRLSPVAPPPAKTPSINSSATASVDSSGKSVASNISGSAVNTEQPLASGESLIQPVPSIASPAERGTKRSRDEMEASSDKSSTAPSPQKNKKRCFICSCKLELAQRTIGRCRCGRVFCALHRLPELHDCEFNHKEDGRREAREKMVKPTRHLGPSYRREEKS